MTQVARIRGPIWTHPSGLMKAARHLPHETLDREAKSGDRTVRRQSTWGMSVKLTSQLDQSVGAVISFRLGVKIVC